MNRSPFSPLFESLDKAIDSQKEFYKEQDVHQAGDTAPQALSGDPKDNLILSLHKTLKQYAGFIEIVPIGVMVQRANQMVYTNREYRRLFGYDNAEELIGQSIMIAISPEDQQEIKNRINKIVLQGSAYNPPLEAVSIKKTGERFYTEAESVSIMYEGEPAVLVIIRDISSRKKAQEALRESEENFKNILRKMPDGISIVNETHVLFSNASFVRMLGFDAPEELEGMEKARLVHPDYQAICAERVKTSLTQGETNPLLKLKLLGKAGQTVEVESSCIPILYYGQQAVMTVSRDITNQNQMERQAILNDKLATLGTLAAGVAHEVNNPLTYVLGNLTFLKEQVEEMKCQVQQKGCMDETCNRILSEMTEELNDITQGGERIRDIVKGLKSFVRGSEETIEKVDLNQVVESAINMTFHVLKQKARLEKDLGVDLPSFSANSGKLQQVFINLLVNAAQAIDGNHPGENKIRIRTGRQNGSLFVEVMDTGRGIPEKILPRIFDPFFTTKPVGTGTGLGLSVCNEILQHYQGRMEVSSQVGMGSTFTVHLPEENGKSLSVVVDRHPDDKKLGRVLVVDDEPGNLEVLSRTLKKQYEVVSALSGQEAMVILQKGGDPVDAIVSDINMPDMDGMALYKTISLVYPGMEKKMVFITGGIFAADVSEFLKKVPNVCLEKPFNRGDLQKAVSQCAAVSPQP